MKYANNAFEQMVNCVAKVISVKGNKHICLFAQRDIEKDEELLFDYGYTPEKRGDIPWMREFVSKFFFDTQTETEMLEAQKSKNKSSNMTDNNLYSD